MTSQRVLDAEPSVVHVVPVTSTIRPFDAEVTIDLTDHNGLQVMSAAQCQHLRAVSRGRVVSIRGNAGPIVLAQIRETIAVLLDLPD